MGEKPIPCACAISGLRIDVTKPPYNADNTGVESATTAIQNAINAAGRAGGGTVYLPPGTYRITFTNPRLASALMVGHSHVIIQGSGTDQTFLFLDEKVTRSKSIIRVEPLLGMSWTKPKDTDIQMIRSDVNVRETIVPLEGAPKFSPGEWVVIQYDVTPQWIAEHNMSDGWDSSVTGPTFYRRVIAVDQDNDTITLDTPVRYDIKVRDHGRVYRVADPLEEVGLSNFSIGMREHPGTSWGVSDYNRLGTNAYDVHGGSTVSFNGVINSWINNVSTYKPDGNANAHIHSVGFSFRQSRFLTIRNVTVENPQYRGAGGNGYPIVIGTQDSLYDNIRAINGRHNFTITGQRASGNVIYRGYIANPIGSLVADFHAHLSMANLIDNLTIDRDGFDAADRSSYPSTSTRKHGVSTTQTVFWNNVGINYGYNRPGIILSDQYGWGYVIGTRGPASSVIIPENNPRTAPVDFLEGEGEGMTLQPQSLYFDQLERRLIRENKEDVWRDVRDDLIPPSLSEWEHYDDLGEDDRENGISPCLVDMNLSGEDVITNGTFEDGLEGWNVGSSVTGSGIEVSVSDGVLTIQSPKVNQRVGVFSQVVSRPEIGGEYVLTARIKTVGALMISNERSSSVYVRLRAAGSSGNTHPLVFTERITETEGWHDLCASIVIPEQTTRIHIEAWVEYVSGTVQFQDFRLIRI